MAKKYKVWLHLEEVDEDNDQYRNLDDEILPLPTGTFNDKEEAIKHMESVHAKLYEDCKCDVCEKYFTRSRLEFKFINGDLQAHAPRVIHHFQTNPDNLHSPNCWPMKEEGNNGEGDAIWYLDVPVIEESYFYSREVDRDKDYNTLTSLIDFYFTT